MVSVNEALDEVGGYRRYSLLSFCILAVSMMIPLACQALNIVFIGFESPHHCKVPEGKPVNESIPLDKYGQVEKCDMYYNDTQGNATTPCTDGWTYTRVYNEQTIVTEWDLVCEHNYLAGLSHTTAQVGAMFGEVLFARLVDIFGRKWVGIVGNIIVAILGTGLAYMPTFVSFICLRTIIAFFVPAILVSVSTLILEICGNKQRVLYCTFLQFGWNLAYLYVGLIAYLIRAWRTLQLVLSLSSLIGLLAIVVPESPYWLVTNKRVKQAEDVVQKIARYNGVRGYECTLSGTEEELLQDQNKNQDVMHMHVSDEWLTIYKSPGEETVYDLFTDRILLKYQLISMSQWFVVGLVYYMTALGSHLFGGDLYLNFTLGGIVEVPAIVASYFIAKKGRNLPIGIFFIITGVLMAALGFTPATTASGTDLTPVIIAELLLLRITSITSWAIILIYVKELFPTNLRNVYRICLGLCVPVLENWLLQTTQKTHPRRGFPIWHLFQQVEQGNPMGTGLGISSVMGRIGSMVVPFVLLAVSNSPLAWLPNLMIGILVVLVGIATLILLPETKDWPLPQSIADIHRYAEQKAHHPIRKEYPAEADVAL